MVLPNGVLRIEALFFLFCCKQKHIKTFSLHDWRDFILLVLFAGYLILQAHPSKEEFFLVV